MTKVLLKLLPRYWNKITIHIKTNSSFEDHLCSHKRLKDEAELLEDHISQPERNNFAFTLHNEHVG